MKITFLYLILFCLLINVYAQNINGWNVLNEGVEVTGLDFIDENRGWMACGNELRKTEDSGETWDSWDLPDSLHIEQIDFINTLIGWCIGYVFSEENPIKNIYRTEDGGLSWLKRSDLTEEFKLRYMTVVNDSVIYIGGTDNEYRESWISKTMNSGNSWQNIIPDSLTEDQFLKGIY